MNLYLWCKDTQKYSDCGIRKYKKTKRAEYQAISSIIGSLPVMRLMNLNHHYGDKLSEIKSLFLGIAKKSK